MPTLPWNQIHTVLLDMDGTLLDLHFDNHFWMEYLPVKLSEKLDKPLHYTMAYMKQEYEKVMGTIDWYCLDFWAQKLDLNIMEMKRDIDHLIQMRDDTIPFLEALKVSGRRVILVTNAHPDSLSLKIEKTQLDEHIDTLVSTHEFGVTKESQELWQKLQNRFAFDANKTLFVDDSLPILCAAREFGIAHLLAVENPDSKKPIREIEEFISVSDYRDFISDIKANPIQ